MLGAVAIVVSSVVLVDTRWIRPASATPGRTELLPDRSAIHYRYALAETKNDEAAAIAALEARDQTTSPFDTAELAELYQRRGQRTGDKADLSKAEQLARRSLELLDSPNPARLTLARLANAHHEFRTAIELAERHLARRGGDARGANLIIATAQLALGDLDHATRAAATALAIRPDPDGYLTRALVEQAGGKDLEAAADFANAARAEQPGDASGAARLRALWARFLIRRGAFTEAQRVIAEAARIAPTMPLVIAQQAELALRTGHPKDAARLFASAYENGPTTRYMIDEARARDLAGEHEKAAILRDRAEYFIRRDAGGHQLELVEALVDGGTSRGVADAIELATTELERRPNADVRYQLARALARAGRYDDARVHVRAALSTGAREAQLFELAAFIDDKLGDKHSATSYRHSARELDPVRAGWATLGL